jgi:hypothetical protein
MSKKIIKIVLINIILINIVLPTMLLLVSGFTYATVKVGMEFDTMLGYHILTCGVTLLVSEIMYFGEFFREYSYYLYNIYIVIALIQGIVYFFRHYPFLHCRLNAVE